MPDRGPLVTAKQRMLEAWDSEEAWRAAVREIFGQDGYASVQKVASRLRVEHDERRKSAGVELVHMDQRWSALAAAICRPEIGSYPLLAREPKAPDTAVYMEGAFTADDLRRILDALENP